ncbi:MAG TPA: AAA family ATPase, partial [Candidatus Dormibacteraeota bacterium]|nr:AAA family ATPase [Candidatus Dormibacteraeota bacterium]
MAALPAGIVAFLLTDLAGSTHAWEVRPDAMRQVLEQHDQIIGRCVEQHGGALVEAGREGDSVLAVFQNTAAAASAALDIQRAVAAAKWPEGIIVRIRIALHAGEAQLRGGHYFGVALNRCARLLATCHPGQIVMTKTVQEILVDEPPQGSELWDLGQHRLKDLKRPEHIFQLVDRDHPARFPPIRSLPHELTNLPVQVTTFVGRQDELRQLRKLQANARLLTLTGPGGCGKTRLGQELASELVSDQKDGVWFADLTPVMDPLLVARAAASGLELQEQVGRTPLETVIAYCRDRQLVLLLDNCEHLIDSCAALAKQLIKSCPGVGIIATSREPLRVPGETVWRVPPLSIPEATRLFLDRALATSPTYAVPETSLPSVARLSERLDGIPLAMELAAARVPMMPVDEILDRLEQGLAFLAGGDRTAVTRQRTLQATMEWSHGLLKPAEQVLFRRLAVFAGNFTLAACEKVCAEPDLQQLQIVDLLGELVSKSLVLAVDGHCRLLDTIRAYANERLEFANERTAMQRHHAKFFLQLAASRRAGALAKWLNVVEENHDNLRAAIVWATQTDP